MLNPLHIAFEVFGVVFIATSVMFAMVVWGVRK